MPKKDHPTRSDRSHQGAASPKSREQWLQDELELAKLASEMGMRPQWVAPGLPTVDWLQQAYALLSLIPPLPSSTQYSTNTRMYARFEAAAWVGANLLWLEEGHQLIVDSIASCRAAREVFAGGFPAPRDGVAVPGAMVADEPIPDPETVKRARLFRYHVDNSVVRSSACFQKAVGLLASYYDIRIPRRNQLYWDSALFSALRAEFGDDQILTKLRTALESDVFKRGQEYRNPWTHGLGTSVRALYGATPELDDVIVMVPAAVGLKPRPVIQADALLKLTEQFGQLAEQFLRDAVDFIATHERPFSPEAPFLPRTVQQPFLHMGTDDEKNPTDYTETFEPHETMRCSALVHNAAGSTITIKWGLGNRAETLGRIQPDEDGEKRLTVTKEPEPARGFPEGRGRFEWWVDGKLAWYVPFEVVADREVRGASDPLEGTASPPKED